ncbi:PKD domain-containing protein [Solirubrobacter ginsenosidimutans]|nr:PKD domain-containing protein [Solirubrobacter ginsenosidimutans]
MIAPNAASAAPGAIKAADEVPGGPLFMDASGSDPTDHTVSVNPGEKVTFSYPTGTSVHNVTFNSVGPQPTNCVQTAAGPGIPLSPAPPIAGFGQPPGWEGNCTFPTPGTYNFFCSIHGNMTGSVVVVDAANTAPTVTAGRTPTGDVPRNSTVAFTATGTDADGDTLTYLWDFGDGNTSPQQNVNHIFDSPGTYTVKVTVDDGKGGTGSATLSVTVTTPNRAPTVTAARTPTGNVPSGTAVAFTATGADLDGDALTYSWNFGDSTPVSTTQNPSHTYAAAGSFTATVTVSDGKGGTGSATVPVTVTASNTAPTVTASRTPAGDGNVNTTFAYTAVGADTDGDTLTYAWDFGDGTTGTGASVSHKFATSGAYNVKVTVDDGKTGTASATVLTTVFGASCTPGVLRDDFNGNELGSAWSVVRRDATLVVNNGAVTIPTQAGDLYTTSNTAKNVVLRTAPTGPWTVTAKINHKGTAQYQQGGIIVYGDDDNYIKLDRTSTNTAGATTKTEFMEFVQEVAATARNGTADHTAVLPAAYDPNYYLRIIYDGTTLIGQYSADGTTWTQAGQSSTALPANAKIGFFALSNAATTTVNAVFDWWQVEGTNVPAIPGCVSAPNANPVITSATRTPSGNVDTNTAVNFAAAATDADGDTLTYTWDFGDTTTSTQQNPTKTYATPGTYTAKVTVTDGKGGTVNQTIPVVVTQGNRAPTVTAAKTPTGTTAPGAEVSFTATGADLDGDALTYSWDFGDSTAASTEQNPKHTYANTGTYSAKVTVSDGKTTGSATVSVVVAGANIPPTVTATRNPTGNTRVGVPVIFAATGTDPDGDPLTYSWDFGDSTALSTDQNPTHTFTTAATFSVKVTVSDGKGGTGSATLSVVVQANRAPTISAATATPTDGVAPLAVTFNATATDPDGHAITYAWDLDGDGTFETTAQNPTKTFNAVTTVTLKVADAFGGSATRALTVNALPAVLDPAARYHVLVFSKTAAFRHTAIPNAVAAIKKLGTENNFTVDSIEDASLFTDAFLARYDLVVFNSTTGDVLNDAQQAAFERFIRAGNGYTGIHSATDTEYTWPWYGQLTGAYFRNHPNGTPAATVVVEDATKASTKDLPARWDRVDEWYNFQGIVNPVVNGGGDDVSPRGNTPIHVLLKMDESTYVESDGTDGVDDDHPIAWCKRFDGGRMFYTALGHTEATYTEPLFLKHLLGGMETAAGMVVDADCGVDPNAAPVLTASAAPTGTIGAGDTVAFNATATDADNDTLTYAWDFGDTATSTQQNPMHTYNTPGTFTAKVTVSDGKGGTATKTFTITVELRKVTATTPIGGDVATQLSLNLGSGPASLGTIVPGIAADYTASVSASITSTAGDAALTVSDPDTVNTGKLVTGTYVLGQPLQVRATNAANPNTAFGAVTGSAAPLTLLSWSRAVSVDPVTVAFKQSVGANEALRAGTYGKTLTFTLSTTTP